MRLKVLVPYPEFLDDLRQYQAEPEKHGTFELTSQLGHRMLMLWGEKKLSRSCLLIHNSLWQVAYAQSVIEPELEFKLKDLHQWVAPHYASKNGKPLNESTVRKALKILAQKNLIEILEPTSSP
jgi:hypothetical protein